MTKEVDAIIHQHENKGKYILIDGVKTFYIEEGSGPVVFCIHGVPTSSFLYRKVVPQLRQHGLRAIAIDLPGLGLSDRPEDFNYTFSHFGKFCNRFLDELGIDKVHLLLHDIGTPVGLSMAYQNSSRIQSITVLNSMLDMEHFEKPLPMRAFEKPILGEAELVLLTSLTFPVMMNTVGVESSDALSYDEEATYIHLLKRGDNGKAFLKIMRHFEQTPEFTAACYAAWKNELYPVQLVWGDNDPMLKYDKYGKQFEAVRPGIPVTQVPARHFLPEEAYEVIAAKVKELVQPA